MSDNHRERNARAAAVRVPLPELLQLLRQSIGGGPDSFTGEGGRAIPFGGDHPDHTLEEVHSFRVAYLWQHIMSKYFDERDPSLSKKALYDKAIQKLREAEDHCSKQPMRWAARDSDPSYSLLRWTVSGDAILHSAARKISRLLGSFSWTKAMEGVDFGPGSTTSLPRALSDAYHKFGTVIPECSTECVPLVEEYLNSFRPLWKGFLIDKFGVTYSIRDSNRITTVPKNFKSDRPIAIEPLWNLWFQKGIGSLIRRRLKRVGIDLNTQENNRRLAVEGSKFGNLATIDLSSASDTVSYWLVERLLPPEWLEALEQCRSRYGVLNERDGDKILYRKFSSMGNGYTFELESLIFWGIVSATVDAVADLHGAEDRRVLVYGDDIICPSYAYDHVTQALRLFGFIPNELKSFGRGPFRESCGMHAFEGHDVTPFYIRRPIRSLNDVFLLYNNLTRWSTRRYNGARDSSIRPVLEYIRAKVPAEWREPRIPDGYGDGAFIGSFDEVRPQSIRSYQAGRPGKAGNHQGWCGWVTGPSLVLLEHKNQKVKARRSSKRVSRLAGQATEFQRLLKSLHVLHKSTRGEPRDDQDLMFDPCGANIVRLWEGIRPDLKWEPPENAVWTRKRLLVSSWTELGPFINFDNPEEIHHE